MTKRLYFSPEARRAARAVHESNRRALKRKISDAARYERYKREGRLAEYKRGRKKKLICIIPTIGRDVPVNIRIQRYKDRYG